MLRVDVTWVPNEQAPEAVFYASDLPLVFLANVHMDASNVGAMHGFVGRALKSVYKGGFSILGKEGDVSTRVG